MGVLLKDVTVGSVDARYHIQVAPFKGVLCCMCCLYR